MKASEFIKDLTILIEERGDLEVVDANDDPVMAIFNEYREETPV